MKRKRRKIMIFLLTVLQPVSSRVQSSSRPTVLDVGDVSRQNTCIKCCGQHLLHSERGIWDVRKRYKSTVNVGETDCGDVCILCGRLHA